jgi:hypothetical protein
LRPMVARRCIMSNPSPTPANRRRARRQQAKRSTKVYCTKGSMGLGSNPALGILDLSETGIRLTLKQQLGPNQELEVNLESMNHRRPLKVLGRVVWCVAAADGTYCAGVEFHRALGYIDFQALIKV